MDSVGAQPSQPSGNQTVSSNNRGKITNILNPLKKSNQTKELSHLSQEQYVAAGRIASPGPPQLELSGSPRSPLLSYSPPAILYQSGGSGIGKSSYFSPHSITSISGQNPIIAQQQLQQQQQQQQQQPIMQSGTRRSKEHSLGKAWDSSSISRRRSRSEDNENAQQQSSDSNYIPYHGPISPRADNQSFIRPSGLVGHSSQPQPSSSMRIGGSESTSSNLVGLGLSDTNQNVSRFIPSYMSSSQRSQQNTSGPSDRIGRTTSPSTTMQTGISSLGRKGGVIMGTGLPTSYTHGGNAPSDVYVPRSGALRDSLPSSMRFDKEQNTITPSGSWAFRRDPFYPTQSQAGPSTQQRTTAFPPSSGQQSKDMKSRTSNSTINSTRRTGMGANSTSSSPMIGNNSMHRQGSSIGSSSEGHSGSFATTSYPAPVKGYGSASTSLTSLRDGSISNKASGTGIRGSSLDQNNLQRNSIQQQRVQQHRKVDSRSTINSQGTRPSISDHEAELAIKDAKGKSTYNSRGVGPGSIRSVQSMQSSNTSPSPSESQRALPKETRGLGLEGTSTAQHSERVSLQPGEVVPSRFIQTLSPIAASSSGETGQLSQSERFEPASASISQTWSENLEKRTPIASSSPNRLIETQIQQQQYAAVKEESESEIGAADNLRRDTQAEAHRRFTLLQQLHLDELTSHAPEAGGWLEPKNGCERVLMPRPTLRGGRSSYDDETAEGYHSEGGQALRRSTRAAQRTAAFERNRRIPATYPRDEDHDASRTQALLAQDQADIFDSANGRNRPFFHHRMPPDVPTDENGQHGDPSGQEQWSLADERPAIPTRTSSRQAQRRRRRSKSSANALGPSTPALTPNIISDSDDEDIPDSSMVLAQGRQLDQEREKWREQHRKSFGAGDPSYRRSQSQHRKSARSSGKKPAPKERTGLRQAKSTPDLREKSKEVTPPLPSPPPTTSCFPTRSKKQGNDQQERLASVRTRSKSMEGLSRLRASAMAAAASLAGPCVGQPSSSHQKRESEKDAERRRSKQGSRRGRALTLSRYDLEKQATLPSDDRIMYDRPFVIGREMDEKNTSPGLGKGPLQIRHPSWYIAGASANRTIEDLRLPPSETTSSTVNQFGAAISSPRPNLGLENKSQEDFSTAGRYATKKGYHRPSNSDELAAYLNLAAAKRANVQARQGLQTESSAGSSSKERDSYQSQRLAPRQSGENTDEEEKRRLSLGMSRVLDSAINTEQPANLQPTPDSEILMRSRPVESLPVPPRRQRTSSTTGRSSLSPLSGSPAMDQERQGSNIDVAAPSTEMTGAEAFKAGRVGIPHSPFTNLQTGFSVQSGAFQTPPLVQPVDDSDWLGSQGSQSRSQDRSIDHMRTNPMSTSSPLRSNQRQARQASTLSRNAHAPASLLDEQDFQTNVLQRSHSSSDRISSEDTASQHSREMLWNTDEHGDEAFNSLFFRRPSQSMSRDLSGLASIYSLPSNTPSTPVPDRRLSNVNLPNQSSSKNPANENLFDEESPDQEDMDREQRQFHEEEVGDATQTSITQVSPTHAADTTIERMMNNLLRFQSQSRASLDRSTRLGRDSALDDNESAWNESSIGDHYAPPQGSINIGGIRAAESSLQTSNPSTSTSRIDQILGMRLGRVHGGRQPQIHDDMNSRPSTRLRDRPDTGLSDVNDDEEEEDESAMMEGDQSSFQMTHEIMPRDLQRPRVESFSASVLMYPTSEQGTQPNSPEQTEERQLMPDPKAPVEGRMGTIDFASPAPPRPLSLADEIATGSILQQERNTSSGHLAPPPSAWQTNIRQSPISSGSESGGSDQNDQHQQQRYEANLSTQNRRESDGIMNMVRSRVWPTPPNPSTEFSRETHHLADGPAEQND